MNLFHHIHQPTFVSTAPDIILDNTNAAVTFNGSWSTGTSSTDKYGPDYRFASTAAGGTATAIYRPYIYTPGYYDVAIWYPQGSNRATIAPWSVVYDGGATNVAVNQQVNGGGWRVIATALPFAQGTNGYVSLSNDTGYSGSVVLADAVRFTYVGPITQIFTLNTTAMPGGAVYRYPDQAQYAAAGRQASATADTHETTQRDRGLMSILDNFAGGVRANEVGQAQPQLAAQFQTPQPRSFPGRLPGRLG